MGYVVLTLILLVVCVSAFFVGRTLQQTAVPEADDAYGSRAEALNRRYVGKITSISSVIVFAVLFLLFTVVRSFHAVPAGHVGVVYQFGNIVGQTDAGLVTILPWRSLKEANVQVQRYSFDELDSFSQETQDVFIKATLNYEVDPKDIQTLYRTVGPNYFEKLVPNRVNQLFKDETVKYKAVDIAPNRERIRENVRDRLKGELAPFSIQVDDLLIDNIKFSPEFTKAIEAKQIATQDAQAAQNRVKEAEYKAQQVIKQAQGQAEANRLKRQTLTRLLVQQNAIDKLNPNVQVLIVPSGSNFLLPSNLLESKP
jgi:regulator of protease activity HflC (stomatin/prohibitin superfamily)